MRTFSSLLVSVSALALLTAPTAFAQGFPASISISDLDGSNGFNMDTGGSGSIRYSDDRVAIIPDINGDGIADMVVAKSHYSSSENNEVFVVFGHAGGFSNPVDLSTLNGSNGFRLYVETKQDYWDFGWSVSSAGDFNNDGVADLLIGSPYSSLAGSNTNGDVYVIFGKQTGSTFAASIDVSTMASSAGFHIRGANDGDNLGQAVAHAGDVNGDTIDDIILGAPGLDGSGAYNVGGAYVVFGHGGAFASPFNVADLDGSNGFLLKGSNNGWYAGSAVAGAGDINNDGFDDILIGAESAEPGGASNAGAAWVAFGHVGPFSAQYNDSALDGSNGFAIYGQQYDWLGDAVSGAGDVNGDGVDDFMVAAPRVKYDYSSAGEVYVILGRTSGFPALFDVSTLDGSNGFTAHGTDSIGYAGQSIAAAGDVNDDGYDDIIIGSEIADPGDYTYPGGAYVLFGGDAPPAALFSLANVDGDNGFVVMGSSTYGEFGASVGGGHDVNNDGVADIIAGSNNNRLASVVFGKTIPSGPTTLFSSVLPGARSGVRLGDPITVFASVVNAGSNRDSNCTITQEPVGSVSVAEMHYQPTDANNVPIGSPDQTFSINPGQTKSFVLAFNPKMDTAFGEYIFPKFQCDYSATSKIPGVNDVLLYITSTAGADILSIGATPTADGTIHLPANGINFMSISAANFGAQDFYAKVQPMVLPGNLAVTLLICETDALGACFADPAGLVYSNMTTASEPHFYGLFVTDRTNGNIPFDPANTRVYVGFQNAVTSVSLTSAAVTTD